MAETLPTSKKSLPTMMDKATLRRVITEMFKELRDLAINGLEDEARFFKWTAKDRPPPEYLFVFPEMVVSSTVNGGIPDDCWGDETLEKLYRGLADNRVQVEVLSEDMKPIKSRSPVSTAAGSKKQRPHERLRDQLIEKIETTIGHPILARTPKAIDPRHDDPLPPNSYKWHFTRKYPRFPKTKGGISRWPAEDMRRCQNALDNGYLVVINLGPSLTGAEEGSTPPSRRQEEYNDDSTSSRDPQEESDEEGEEPVREPVDSDDEEEEEALPDAPQNTAEPPNAADAEGDADFNQIANTFKEEIEELDGEIQTSRQLMGRLVELHGRMFEDSLHLAVQRHTEEQKLLWKARHARQKDKLRDELRLLSGELETNLQELETTLNRVSNLEAENKSLASQLAKMKDETTARLAQTKMEAKKQGEDEGRRKTIDDINSSMEKENSALRRSHLEQVVEVRRESYKQGFDAGKQEAMSTSLLELKLNQADVGTDQSPINIEAFEKIHQVEKKAALEHGRRQGREMAYQELALSSGDRVNILLQNHTELNKNRKVRELKTIQQNWLDIPQRVLLSYMLPEGHTPGDKTLYLLARLSKEVDSTKAGQLLAEEINRRCKDMLAETNSRIVTNADVQNVLNNVSPTNRRGTTAHSEPSPSAQTPQSSRLTAGAKPNSSSQSKKQLTTISKDNTKASPSNSQKSQAASLQKFFTPALQVWLDTTSTHHLHPNSPTTTILALPPPELRRMESTILQHSKSAGIAGVDYCKATPAELKKLKGYLAGLTLELSSEFEFPGVRRGEDVVDIFMAIYAMFFMAIVL